MKRGTAILLFLCVSMSLTNNAIADIAAQDFFKVPATLSIAMSPDGSRLAASTGTDQGIVIIDAATGNRSNVLALGTPKDDQSSLSNIGWIDSDTIAVQFTRTRKGVSNLLDTRTSRSLLVIVLRPGLAGKKDVLSVRTSGWLVDTLPGESGQFLYAKSGIRSTLYRLRVDNLAPLDKHLGKLDRLDGGQFVSANRVADINGYATRWFLNSNNAPLAVLHYQDINTIVLSDLAEDGTEASIQEWTVGKEPVDSSSASENEARKIIPVAVADQNGGFYALDLAEDEQRSIYKVNYKEKSEELIYETEADQIVDIIISADSKLMIGAVVLRNGEYHSLYLTPNADPAKSKLTSRNWNLDILVEEKATNALHYIESHNQPGQYFVQNTKNNQIQLVASLYPHLDKKLTSVQVPGSVSVEDLDVGYFLNLPQKNSANASSLVVIPHGGPFGVFDTGYFDLTTQFFTANGYAVLRVNFRGSGGFGQQLEAAGKGQWGHLMLEDILHATRTVTSRSDIDEQRVCIFGMSYGGYAAISMVLSHPDVYHCGVSVAGVTDINLLLSRSGLSQRTNQWYRDNVGDSILEYEALKSISPVYSIEHLTVPLLVMHGDEDQVVDIEHASRLRMMMDKHQVNYSWHIFPGMDHHFADTEETVELFTRVESYIRSQLDGLAAP